MELQRSDADDSQTPTEQHTDDELPQCKIKRNYSCNHCTYFTQNPRFYLTHLRDLHGERIVINKCNLCLYASRHYQKLVRHMKMVHGSTEGIAGQSRKRTTVEDNPWNQLQKKIPTPTLIFPIETTTDFTNLPNDLELSRKSLKDIAALYFAENQIDSIMTQMEEADAVQLPKIQPRDLRVAIKRKASCVTFFDELKKSFVEEENLACRCGNVSKCFSESVIHRKTCNYLEESKPKNEMLTTSLTTGSTRCQQCRRRCKSSADLLKHLKNCSRNEPSPSMIVVDHEPKELDDSGGGLHSSLRKSPALEDTINGKCKITVVEATFEIPKHLGGDSQEENYSDLKPATGCDEVSNKKTEEEVASASLKKVFKCPCCSFWASTASRFHVHIVGHLNKKPFKCSLCAYRSNWRWDITKHIRIKTIRNPNHKNARVIMSDETGRRNYTKYNKYITLMKLNDEDGDPRQIRCGEMTPNQEASLAFLNDFNKTTSTLEQLNQKKAKQRELNTQAGSKRSTSPLIRTSEDLIRDVKIEGLEKKTFYNCRKCHFRHANRDAVLAHVKIHHHDSGRLPSPFKSNLNTPVQATDSSVKLNMNTDFAAALCLSPKHLLQEKNTHSNSNNNQHSILSKFDGLTSTISSLPKEVASSKESADGLNSVEHHEVAETINPPAISASSMSTSPSTCTTDKTSPFIKGARKLQVSVAATTSNNFINDTNDKREPSPFRCGHCHQVSNWKHVIQRHCRLKHSGQIQIEAFDRSSDARAPVYRPLDFFGSGSLRQALGSIPEDTKQNTMKVHQQEQQNAPSTDSNAQDKSKSEPSLKALSVSSSNSDQETTSSPNKQLKCPSCPYVSEDKLQLNFHISLHKPLEYKCSQCSYICTKKQHLSSHVKSHDKANTLDVSDTNDGKPPAVLVHKVISYCPRCPEAFINSPKKLQQHLKAHSADLDLKCDVCDFSTKQKALLLSHSFAHTSTYQEKAQLIAKEGREDSEYPSQKVQQITLSNVGATAWVVANCRDFKQLKTITGEDTATSTSDPSISKKCPYCPFQSACHKSLQHHLQYHVRVSKRLDKHTCEQCDFSTSSKINLAEHTRIHSEDIDHKISVSLPTSKDKLNPSISLSNGKKDEKHSSNDKVDIKSDSKVVERKEKTEKELCSNRQSTRRTSALKDEKKSSQPSPSHKTILVNPKTGQVIKRN